MKDLNVEKDETDMRFDNLVEEHTDTIEELEKKAEDISSKLNLVNETLKKVDKPTAD